MLKRKIISLMIAFTLLFALLCPVLAEEIFTAGAKLYSTYLDDGVLYTFVHIPEGEPVPEDAALLVNSNLYQKAQLKSVKDAGATIHFMLLVDTSTSMAEYRSQVSALAKELMGSWQNLKVTVARFGMEFSVVASELTQWEEVRVALNSLSYTDDSSNISGSTAAAIEALGREDYPDNGEMTNLVVITDGEPWYSSNQNREIEQETQANSLVVRTRSAYPEIVVHSYSFGVWDPETYLSLTDERGLQGDSFSAKEMGEALAEYANLVYCIQFPMKDYEELNPIPDAMTLTIGHSILPCGVVRNTAVEPTIPSELETTESPKETTASTQPPEETTASTQPPEETVPLTEPLEETAIPTVPAESTAPGEETTTTNAASESGPSIENTGYSGDSGVTVSHGIHWWIWFLGAGCLALFVLVILINRGRTPRDAIRMKIELLAGANVRLRDMYYLDNEILIGSDRKCHVVIPGVAAGSTNARIFKKNQILYVEDIGMSEGILLNNMRIFSSNRLRSGDEITIGSVTIRVLF